MNNTNNAVTITGSGKIAAYINGKAHNVATDHPNYQKLLEAARTRNWDAFAENIEVSTALNSFLSDGVEVVDGVVMYKGESLHNSLTKKIVEFMTNDLPFQPLVKFLENLLLNPSKRAVDELYDFLEVGELPITEDGHFLAFKNVRPDYFDIHTGNTHRNMIGDKPSMQRNRVDDNRERTCSDGLHFCSIAYLPHFSYEEGGHTMIVKVNPRDVVSIPADYNNTKGRACLYEVVDEYTEDWRAKLDKGENGFNSPLYAEDGSDLDLGGGGDDDTDTCADCGGEFASHELSSDGLCDFCQDKADTENENENAEQEADEQREEGVIQEQPKTPSKESVLSVLKNFFGRK